MGDRKFIRLMIIVVLLGMMATIAHCVFIYFAYQNSSIIQFIAREWWL